MTPLHWGDSPPGEEGIGGRREERKKGGGREDIGVGGQKREGDRERKGRRREKGRME